MIFTVSKPKIENEQLIEEAEAWIVKLRSDQVSQQDKEAFSAWLNLSDSHVKAFDEAMEVWDSLSVLAHVPESTFIDDQPKAGDTETNTLSPLKHRWSSLKYWNTALASAAVCAFCVVALNWLYPSQEPITQYYSTAAGEVLNVELEDGSIVELNTQTALEVTFTEKQRSLTLTTGEAYFSVASDRERPFVVDFGNGTATAVGTAFNIYTSASETSVTVTEGIVDVKEPVELAIPNPQGTRVVESQQVKIGRRGLGPVKNIDTSRSVAWRDNTIIFRDTPLPSAIVELNRYLDSPVNVEHSGLPELNVSGTFSLESPVETLDAITTAFNLKKVETSGQYYLYTRTQ